MGDRGQDIAERTARVGDVELAYEVLGDPGGPAVLAIMGLGAQLIFWPDALCDRLVAEGFCVVRFDNRDAGRSTILGEVPPPDFHAVARGEADAPYLLADLAADAAGLMDFLELDAAHVVGVSMGGMVAQRLAIDRPDRVLSLASIMSTTGDRSVGNATPGAMDVLMAPAPPDRDGFIEATVRSRSVIGSQPPDLEAVRELAGRTYDRGVHPAGTARQLAAIIASPDHTPDLRRLAVPTVAIHGSEDPLIDRSGGEATAAAVPDAELLIIEGMGHDLPAWALDRIAAALLANFERAAVDGAPSAASG
jgi:pimeloyl-ACP methyl ester carboxylesterase